MCMVWVCSKIRMWAYVGSCRLPSFSALSLNSALSLPFQATVVLRNVSSASHQLRVLPPQTPFFSVSLGEYYSTHIYVRMSTTTIYTRMSSTTCTLVCLLQHIRSYVYYNSLLVNNNLHTYHYPAVGYCNFAIKLISCKYVCTDFDLRTMTQLTRFINFVKVCV